MPERHHEIAIAVLAATLAGCAGRAIESHELHAVDKQETAPVHELVAEVHTALAALSRILKPPDDAPGGLQLVSAVATLETRHADDGVGHLSMLIPSSSGMVDSAADNKIELTFRPAPGFAAATPGIERLVSLYRDAAPCALPEPGADSDNGDSEPPPLSMALVQASMAALDGYRCAQRRAPHIGFVLDALNVTINIDQAHSETEGAVFRLGGFSIGAETVQSAESIATVKLTFSGNDTGQDSPDQ